MKNVSTIEFISGSKEELLPDFEHDFPYISSRVELDHYPGQLVPWHWHKETELFYIQEGTLEYDTPGGKMIFPRGSGGIVNVDILHMTRPAHPGDSVVQFVHLFDPAWISGGTGSRIEKKYILPLLTDYRLEIIGLFPDHPGHRELLTLIHDSFMLSEHEFGYEIKIRNMLSEIWLQIMNLSLSRPEKGKDHRKQSNILKRMMVHIHEHYPEKITIPELAAAAFISERECYRVFQESLSLTPVDYMKKYRLQAACRLLLGTSAAVTEIGQACGLGSSSYFGKVFRDCFGCTPLEYRREWQNRDR